LFIAVKGAFVTRETLEAFRNVGIVTYCFYPDVSFIAHGRYLPRSLPIYNWIFITKSFGPKDLKERLGISGSSFLPHAYDPAVHQPREATPELLKQLGADVSFIGSWSPKKQRLLEGLVKRRPNLKLRIWGNSWNRLPRDSNLHDFTSFKPIVGIGYASAISCSKVNLGILSERVHGASSGDLITSRTFHIPACGGLLLHERTSDLLKIFSEGESCVCFGDPDELVAKVDELLADDTRRKAIAERGRRVVTAGHSWDHRARTILDHYLAHDAKHNA
jgi:spore maturation protein CgeB